MERARYFSDYTLEEILASNLERIHFIFDNMSHVGCCTGSAKLASDLVWTTETAYIETSYSTS